MASVPFIAANVFFPRLSWQIISLNKFHAVLFIFMATAFSWFCNGDRIFFHLTKQTWSHADNVTIAFLSFHRKTNEKLFLSSVSCIYFCELIRNFDSAGQISSSIPRFLGGISEGLISSMENIYRQSQKPKYDCLLFGKSRRQVSIMME